MDNKGIVYKVREKFIFIRTQMKSLRTLTPALMVAAAAVLFVSAVVFCHVLLQDNRVYNCLSFFVKTYERVEKTDGSIEINRVTKPFVSPDNDNMLSWEAAHYDEIRQHLYSPEHTWHGDFAFYPLFPLLWRLLDLSPLGISLLNLVLYIIGLALVALIFGNNLPRWSWILLLCTPMVVVFMIPYSEALFFLGIALGMLGLARNHYWLYFIGFFLASTTRAAGNLMIVAWIIVDILDTLNARSSVKKLLRDLICHLAPVIIGALVVMLFQHLRGAEHWFEYVLAQKEWGKELSWPTWPFTDWSKESESVTKPLIFILFIPALVWLALKFKQSIKASKEMDTRKKLRLLSVLFFVGNVILALFTQNGCLFSQARLLTCTPFFAFLLLDFAASEKPRQWRWGLLATMTVTLTLCLFMFSKTNMRGVWVVFLLVTLVFFGDGMKPWLRNTLLAVTIALNIFWTAYLFNCFLTNGFIFT